MKHVSRRHSGSFTGLLAALLSVQLMAAPTSLPLDAEVTTAPAKPTEPISDTSKLPTQAASETPASETPAPPATSLSGQAPGEPAAAATPAPSKPAAAVTSPNPANPANPATPEPNKAIEKSVKQTVIVNKNGPARVEVMVNNNGEEQQFSFSGDELKDKALIDKRLSALDNDSRTAILSAIDDINSGKLRLLKKGELEELHTLEREMASKQEVMQKQGDELARRGEEMARLGESIERIMEASLQHRELDGEGKRMITIHQLHEGEVSVQLHSIDEDKMRFDMVKSMLGDAKLSDEQKAELKALLAK
ncbi:hypothetical protein KJI95_14450 [Shewanella sp. JM162201]|uniref:Uncharacterized protein n=1 Tax=Shewanella jiangmenensis TaxID=2837387 RepID=A0ABS5V7S1_9GAMM|nr:hypothetical protein [Shewanella jiangmenensis]MBT1445711.1 hypothetical protein [Shewanella jiangmenensis]